jgi:hypothetical protein
VWNILLLGSDNDQKFSFPALLTQVMLVVHVDTVQNTVTMLSIARDSWVYVLEVGSMHKIDQAFLLGAGRGIIYSLMLSGRSQQDLLLHSFTSSLIRSSAGLDIEDLLCNPRIYSFLLRS